MKNFLKNKMFKKIPLSIFSITLVLGGFLFFNILPVQAAITSINLTAPDGSENWRGTQNITWTSENDGTDGLVHIYYCKGADCGSGTWTRFANDITNTGSYSWVTTGVSDGADYKIRVASAYDSILIGHNSNAVFAIDNATPTAVVDSVDFSADTGTDGDFITKTAAQDISGTYSGVIGAGEILKISLDDGSTWSSATSAVGGAWTLTGQTLTGRSTLKARIIDLAGNYSTALSQPYVLDQDAPVISGATPLTGTFNNDARTVGYTLGEAAVSGTIKFTRSGGTADAQGAHTYALTGDQLTLGAHTVAISVLNANGTFYTTNPLVDGTIYTIDINATDLAGNAATQVRTESVTYDTTEPTAILTVGTATIYEGDLEQEITVTYNEDMAATPVPAISFSSGVWALGSGSWTTPNRVWHQHATITDNNQEIDPTTAYAISAKDLAGNTQSAQAHEYFILDTLAPSAPTIGAFTPTGGTAGDAGHINASNTGFTQKIVAPATNFAGTAHLYVNGAEFGVPLTISVNAGAPSEFTLTGNAASITNLGSDGDTVVLTVKIIDAVGNIGTVSGNSIIHLDKTSPIIGTIALGVDAYINATEASSGVNITADTTAEAGQLMTCNITDAGSAHTVGPLTGTVDGSGNVTIPTGSLTSLDNTLLTATCGISDQAGNSATPDAGTATKKVSIPTIASITSTTGDGYYNEPDTINNTVTFSEAVAISGSVTLSLDSGGNCVIGAGASSATHACTYTVVSGHNSADLNVSGVSGGTITDIARNQLTNYSIPEGENLASHSAIVIDTVHPVIDTLVSAGIVSAQFLQNATVTDTNSLIYHWTVQGSPRGTVTFGSHESEDTTVAVSGADGVNYTIRLTATDAALNSSYSETSFTWSLQQLMPILGFSPVDRATNVAITDGTATVTFNEDIILLDGSLVTLVEDGGASKAGTIVVSGNPHILNIPYTGLENSHTYRINILSGAVVSVADGDLNVEGVSYFTTVAAGDTIAPPVPVITTATATIDSDSYMISGTAAVDTPSDSARTIHVYKGGSTLVGTAYIPVGQTAWSVNVSLTQNATNSFTAKSTDAAGNQSIASTAVVISESAGTEPTEISVTNTSLVKRIATKNGVHVDGWKWILDVTLPTASTTMQMSFDNLTGAGTILAHDNIRFYSAESSDHNATSSAIVIDIPGAGAETAWSHAMTLDHDLYSNTPGRQIQITIEAAVPLGSTDGAYSANYDIREVD